MLTPERNPELPNIAAALVAELSPIFSSIRETCRKVGIDVEAAERACMRCDSSQSGILPWGRSPSECALSSLELLKHEPSPSLDASTVMDNLIREQLLAQYPQAAYIAAAILCEARNWSSAAKQAAVQLSRTEPMEHFELGAFEDDSEARQTQDCEALKAWLVYNTLTADAIDRLPVSDTTPDVVNLMLRDETARLACLHLRHLQTGALAASLPLSKVEDSLMKLGAVYPQAGERITDVLSHWEFLMKQKSVTLGEFEMEIESVLPDQEPSHSLDGAAISKEAATTAEDFRQNRKLLTDFKALSKRPEWSNPLEAIRELAAKRAHRIYIGAPGGIFGPSSIDLLHRVLEGMPAPVPLVFASSVIKLASGKSAPVEGILEGLRDFVTTGRKSFAEIAGVAPANKQQLEVVMSALSLFRDLVGPSNIHLVMDRDMKGFLAAKAFTSGLIFCEDDIRSRRRTIKVDLYRRGEPNDDSAADCRLQLAGPLASIPEAASIVVTSLVSSFVAPAIVRAEGGADQYGLVGFKPSVALRVAGEAGLLQRPIPRENIPRSVALKVIKVQDDPGDDAFDPQGVEDNSLIPTRL